MTNLEIVDKHGGDMLVRVARKAHKCRTHAVGRATLRGYDFGELPEGHTPHILPGHAYVEYLGEALVFQSGARYCAACAIAAGIAAPVVAAHD
jgi:hypothetical protein